MKFDAKKKEKKTLKVIHTLQYHVLNSFWSNPFRKKDIGIIDKGNLQLQGKGKNYLSNFFYSNFVFSKLKVTNIAHNEPPFVIVVFGTQLASKNVKESHVVQKKFLELNWVSFWLYGWYVKP